MEKNEHYLTTNEFAAKLCVTAATVRRGLCVNGHYLGIRPAKLPNGRLLWTESDANKIVEQSRV